MDVRKATDILLERIKYFINAVENGEYQPTGYEFTIKFHANAREITVADSYFKN